MKCVKRFYFESSAQDVRADIKLSTTEFLRLFQFDRTCVEDMT